MTRARGKARGERDPAGDDREGDVRRRHGIAPLRILVPIVGRFVRYEIYVRLFVSRARFVRRPIVIFVLSRTN